MTFYLKHRSQTIEELDLKSVRETLRKIVDSGNIPHAFLFSGPKGTGKTSAARILAKILNCEKEGKEPCNKCEQCTLITKSRNLDVVELDAASNRGIDDIRSLRDKIALAPAKARKKVYIIDEAHMLTTEAANAFLKTLEEPPEHVYFILATTNPEKLPATIRSRLTNIIFTKANKEEITRQLTRIAKKEKLKVEKEVYEQIALASEGSFRDAAKLLEQLALESKNINKEIADKLLGIFGNVSIEEAINLLHKRDVKKLLIKIEEMVAHGENIVNFLDYLLERFQKALLAKKGIGEEDLVDYSEEEILDILEILQKARKETVFSVIPQLPLEIAIVLWCKKTKNSLKPVSFNPDKTKDKLDPELWSKILSFVKSKNTSVEALLRAAKPLDFNGSTLTLGVYYRFHKERLETVNSRKTLEEVVKKVMGVPVRVSYTLVGKEKTPKDTLTQVTKKDIIEVAKEIFGN